MFPQIYLGDKKQWKENRPIKKRKKENRPINKWRMRWNEIFEIVGLLNCFFKKNRSFNKKNKKGLRTEKEQDWSAECWYLPNKGIQSLQKKKEFSNQQTWGICFLLGIRRNWVIYIPNHIFSCISSSQNDQTKL